MKRSSVVVEPGFKPLWACQIKVIDDINRRSQGWSQVGKIELATVNRSQAGVPAYLKRQQNYRTRTICHPFQGIATLKREYRMLNRVIGRGIGVAPPLYFAEGSSQRAVLVIEALEHHRPLDLFDPGNRLEADQVIDLAAPLIARLHRLGICHGCLYPKHLFWRSPGVARSGDIRVIDWEKARFSLRRKRSRLRDLDSLNRHAHGWSLRQRLRFLAGYLDKPLADPEVRVWWQQLVRKLQIKAAS